MDHSALPNVAEALELPELRAGEPELLAGAGGLGREIRWAHVVAGPGAAELLDGGELVLTTGAGWPRSGAPLAAFANALTTAGGTGVAAIVFELGAAFSEIPKELRLACTQHEVPLIALHRPVRFVQITQRVHQRLLAARSEELQAREAVHAMLTELGLNRSPVDYMVERLAATLNAPVVLEDSSHRVVALALQGEDPTASLAPWQKPGAPLLPNEADRVAVEARGHRWGFLTALAGPAHPAGRHTVLELGAIALALGRLSDADDEQWLQLASKRAFTALLSGRYRNDVELEVQLTAAGLPIRDRVVLAATVHGTGDFGAHALLERTTIETALRRAVAPEGRVLLTSDEHAAEEPILALISLPKADPRIDDTASGRSHAIPPLASRLAHELEMLVPEPTPAAWRAHLALGFPGRRLRELVASLEQLRAIGRLPAALEVGRVTVQQAARQPLAHLVRALSATPEMQRFSAEMLEPLLEHDRVRGPGHTGDLIEVLQAAVRHPGNRSAAAAAARLSRSVFYQRLELIETLLGIDLSDGETLAALTVALLARQTP